MKSDKILKNKIFKVGNVVIIMFLFVIFLFKEHIPVNAAIVNETGNNSDFESSVSFLLGDEIKGQLSEGENADFYDFEVQNEGKIDIKFYTKIPSCSSRIYNANYEQVWSSGYNLVDWDTVTHSKIYKTSVYLAKGKYYLAMCDWSGGKGSYDITTEYIPANSTYEEPNDTFEQASKIEIGKTINGMIDETCESDIYKLVLSNSANLKLKMNVGANDFSMEVLIYNADGERIWSSDYDFVDWNIQGTLTRTESLELDKGTYYFAITPWAGYTKGLYSYKFSIVKGVQKIKVSTNMRIYSKAQLKKNKTFNIGAKAKGNLTYKVVNGKNYISVSSKGRVTIKKNIPKGTYRIKIIAKETQYYKSTTKTIKIKIK